MFALPKWSDFRFLENGFGLLSHDWVMQLMSWRHPTKLLAILPRTQKCKKLERLCIKRRQFRKYKHLLTSKNPNCVYNDERMDFTRFRISFISTCSKQMAKIWKSLIRGGSGFLQKNRGVRHGHKNVRDFEITWFLNWFPDFHKWFLDFRWFHSWFQDF